MAHRVVRRALIRRAQLADEGRHRQRLDAAVVARLVGHLGVVNRCDLKDRHWLAHVAAGRGLALHYRVAVEQPRVVTGDPVGEARAVAVPDYVDLPRVPRIPLRHERREEGQVVYFLGGRRAAAAGGVPRPVQGLGVDDLRLVAGRVGDKVVPLDLPGDDARPGFGGGRDAGEEDDDGGLFRQGLDRRDDLIGPLHVPDHQGVALGGGRHLDGGRGLRVGRLPARVTAPQAHEPDDTDRDDNRDHTSADSLHAPALTTGLCRAPRPSTLADLGECRVVLPPHAWSITGEAAVMPNGTRG